MKKCVSILTNPSDTFTLTKPYKYQKKAIHYQTFLVRPEVSFIVKAEESTKDLQNLLNSLERGEERV
jgi:hypothetical protein